jgi:hypothetical protein
MKRLLPLVLSVAGLLDLVLLGLLFKAVLGRYLVLFLLGFFGLCFVVTLVAFLLFIFTVPLGPSRKD